MTLAQLQSFVLVARLGSVKAAAAELGVTEPAVSVAVAALRKELGDELFVREGRGIALTSGGRRLAALASEILGLAEQARRSVPDTAGQPQLMQVAVSVVVAEHVGPLVDAFTAKEAGLEVEIESVPGESVADMLERRRADIVLGPAPAPETCRNDRHGAVPALAAGRRRRTRAPARRRRARWRRRGWRASAGCSVRLSSIRRPGQDCCSPVAESSHGMWPPTPATPRRSPRRSRAMGSSSRSRMRCWRRFAGERSSGSTSAAPRWSSSGTRARSASVARYRRRWHCSASRPAPRPPRRSPAVAPEPRRPRCTPDLT